MMSVQSPSRLTLAGIAWRNLYARLGRTVLTLLGIALGVGGILATVITNRNIAYTLDGLFDRALGNADLQVVPLEDERTLVETALEVVSRTPGVRLAAPLVRIVTVVAGTLDAGQGVITASGQVEMGRSVEVDGIDVALEPQMRVYTLAAGRFPSPGEYEVMLPLSFAEENELALGRDLLLSGPYGTARLRLMGLLANEGAALVNGGNIALASIDVLPEVFSLSIALAGTQLAVLTPARRGGRVNILRALKHE